MYFFYVLTLFLSSQGFSQAIYGKIPGCETFIENKVIDYDSAKLEAAIQKARQKGFSEVFIDKIQKYKRFWVLDLISTKENIKPMIVYRGLKSHFHDYDPRFVSPKVKDTYGGDLLGRSDEYWKEHYQSPYVANFATALYYAKRGNKHGIVLEYEVPSFMFIPMPPWGDSREIPQDHIIPGQISGYFLEGDESPFVKRVAVLKLTDSSISFSINEDEEARAYIDYWEKFGL